MELNGAQFIVSVEGRDLTCTKHKYRKETPLDVSKDVTEQFIEGVTLRFYSERIMFQCRTCNRMSSLRFIVVPLSLSRLGWYFQKRTTASFQILTITVPYNHTISFIAE